MQSGLTEQRTLSISTEALLNIIGVFTGGTRGREDDEHPLPPGPWPSLGT